MTSVTGEGDAEGKSGSATGATQSVRHVVPRPLRVHAGMVLMRYLECHRVRGLDIP